MLIWSVMNDEIIRNGFEDIKQAKDMIYNGKHVQVIDMEDGSYQIIRLLSGSPKDYMNSKFQPGSIIKCK